VSELEARGFSNPNTVSNSTDRDLAMRRIENREPRTENEDSHHYDLQCSLPCLGIPLLPAVETLRSSHTLDPVAANPKSDIGIRAY
jgi:hypothetical protein